MVYLYIVVIFLYIFAMNTFGLSHSSAQLLILSLTKSRNTENVVKLFGVFFRRHDDFFVLELGESHERQTRGPKAAATIYVGTVDGGQITQSGL